MWLELQIFGFRALWSPYYLLFLIGLAILYFFITGPYRKKFNETDAPPTALQQMSFYCAIVLLYMVKGSPIDLLSHIMLTAHMIQMAIYYLIVPILIIKGIPAWIWKKVVDAPGIAPVIRLLTKPVISLLLFNGLFSIYHIPVVFDFAKSSQFAHTSISLVILVAAFIVWWPIVTPLKEFDTMKPMLKMLYIFANSVLITPACVLIIFAGEPLFATYSQSGEWVQALALCVPGDVLSGIAIPLSGPEMFSPLSTMVDQQLGGIIMKVVQEITYGVLLGRVIFQWFKQDGQTIDPLPAESN
ncbi:cytochrome c oxidase assembly factor CtaG [Lentibacillus sediminis]|uniref:cytochrome c oxidase assembly factor CtaG n=1 Tax=Lentibacillus sediminis TaxID=1940529 RepID=UPI000C1C241C|nr:cytochrome c oxidase assembly factor CtaG [Lentibacillus sediminis]